VTRREFAAATEAVRSARVFVATTPEASGADLNTLELLVSELVTNAVLHAQSTIVVDVERIDDVLRVGVRDSSSELPVRRSLEPTAESGRGLNIVHTLALRWGVDFDGQSSGKRVWFEIPLGIPV
jgi:anti-sigma regulatory factor (Ser/Thr protein kinase)